MTEHLFFSEICMSISEAKEMLKIPDTRSAYYYYVSTLCISISINVVVLVASVECVGGRCTSRFIVLLRSA